jgi:hypothetical protein
MKKAVFALAAGELVQLGLPARFRRSDLLCGGGCEGRRGRCLVRRRLLLADRRRADRRHRVVRPEELLGLVVRRSQLDLSRAPAERSVRNGRAPKGGSS